jgi:hypothetical protein
VLLGDPGRYFLPAEIGSGIDTNANTGVKEDDDARIKKIASYDLPKLVKVTISLQNYASSKFIAFTFYLGIPQPRMGTTAFPKDSCGRCCRQPCDELD